MKKIIVVMVILAMVMSLTTAMAQEMGVVQTEMNFDEFYEMYVRAKEVYKENNPAWYEKAWNWTTEAETDAKDWTVQTGSNVWNWTKITATGAADWTVQAATNGWTWTSKAATDAWNWVIFWD